MSGLLVAEVVEDKSSDVPKVSFVNCGYFVSTLLGDRDNDTTFVMGIRSPFDVSGSFQLLEAVGEPA